MIISIQFPKPRNGVNDSKAKTARIIFFILNEYTKIANFHTTTRDRQSYFGPAQSEQVSTTAPLVLGEAPYAYAARYTFLFIQITIKH